MVAQAVFALVPSYFAFRCMYNYNYVFKELRESEGFPNFIANTADLYGDKMWLFPELLKAHQQNDKAVMMAYGFWGKLNTESDCVAALMEMYAEMTK